MKAMGTAAAAGVGGHAHGVGGAERGRHRSFEVSYPATRKPTQLIATTVLLEMGVRGGSHPHETVSIGSLLGDALAKAGTDLADYEDLVPFHALVLHPARTLLEKLFHIHELSLQLTADEDMQPDPRSGRHFYDVHELLGDARVLAFLEDPAQTRRVIQSIDTITDRYFGGSKGGSTRPASGFATSPAFDIATTASERLRAVYGRTMLQLYFGADPLPTWEQICARVRGHAALL